jgi:AcrR family transcriptional regulator
MGEVRIEEPVLLNRNERRKARTKEKIREAALAAFAKYGYLNTTIQQIMETADLGYGTFYQYYHHKQEILAEFSKNVQYQIAEAYKPLPRTEKSIYKRTLHSIHNVYQIAHEHREILRMLKDGAHVDEVLKAQWEAIGQLLFQRLENDITWSMKHGLCREVDLTIALGALHGMVNWYTQHIIHHDCTDEEIRKIAENVSLLFKEAIFCKDWMPDKTSG